MPTIYAIRITVFSLLLSLPLYITAQVSLRGQVTDHYSGQPLPGAAVEIHELDLTVLTDENGQYQFNNLKPALYHLHFTYVGYSAATVSVRVIEADQLLDFTLVPTSIELQEILVESNHFKTGAKEHTLAMEILDAAYLRDKGRGTLAKALEDIPGINAIQTGVGIAKPVIRGMSHNRIIVNHLGIKQEGQQWGSDHGLEIDVFEPGRIEIIKGPSSLRYGSDGLGGVINIFAPRLPADSSFEGSFQTLYKSNNHLFGTSAMVQGSRNDRVFRARISTQDFGDYRVPADEFTYNSYILPLYENRLKNTAGRERNLSLMGGVKKNWGYSTLTVSNFYQKAALFVGAVGIPRSYQLTPDGNNRNIDLPYQQTNHFKVISNTSLLWGRNWTEIDLGYQVNSRQEHSNPHAHGKSELDESTLAHGLNLQTLSGNFRRYQQKNRWMGVWGLQVEVQKNTRKGFEFLLPNFRRLATGIYLTEEFSWKNRYTLSGGLRLDYGWTSIEASDELISTEPLEYYRRNEAISKNFGNLSGSLGLSYYPSYDFNVKVNLGTSFRMPTAQELAINGIHHGTFRHEVGNPNLTPERGYQLDANISVQKKYLSLVLTGFGAFYHDYIYLAPTARFSSSLHPIAFPEGGQIYQFTQHNAVYGGGEFAIDFHPIHPLHIKSTFECVYNRNLDTQLPLPFTPPPAVFSEVSYELEWDKGLFQQVHIGVNFKNSFAQTRTDRNEAPTGAYHIWGAKISGKLSIGKVKANLSLAADNLLNVRYINHLSRYKLLNLPEQGRNFTVNLHIPFATL